MGFEEAMFEEDEDEPVEDIPQTAQIEGGEMETVDDPEGKVSLRHMPKKQQRRQSRTTTRKDKMSSKTSGIRIKWGISMN